ncbi:RidA family protein [Pleomorphomonas diazotrophica]|uniref:RidA family protein n=1 Tax=Pleomorphomonas diazotrophica TaxID=1166257 RepID=A0A1I4R5Z5_9HYPH|nr:RidA family protein [Pleomorphomonas diazotrophica]PKR90192.1 RidA family protein [Pleomorphomonas diazotrophica]SFM47406.1 Enamine deaminase RidA, house cleaning of reactive enamine intermediates, YjgF/YER057c/UK114 family [Pleomorphomonas diazotrophica]
MQFRNPAGVHAPVAAYSHQAEVPAGARWLVMAGQVGMRPDGSLPVDPAEQLEVALDNVRHNLEAAGMGIGDLVKMTTYLVGEVDPDRRRQIFGAFFGDHRPCTTLLYVSALGTPALKAEVDAWAAREAQEG